MYSWEDLAGLALARQFPDVEGRDVDAVVDVLHRTVPVQAQTARSPFIGLAARMPGVTLETISAAYDAYRIVRGSNIRGTVHTSTPDDNALLEVATRLGQRTLWERTLKLTATSLEDVWAGIEEYARDDWRTPTELSTHLNDWLREHDPAAGATLDNAAGRYFGFGHGGLIRRSRRRARRCWGTATRSCVTPKGRPTLSCGATSAATDPPVDTTSRGGQGSGCGWSMPRSNVSGTS